MQYNRRMTSTPRLCLACGLCCNGAINQYTRVQVDEAGALLQQGLPVQPRPEGFFLEQPCAALQPDLLCRVYALRPQACRRYECKLYKKHAAGLVSTDEALAIIARARRLQADETAAATFRAYLARHFEPARPLRVGLKP